MKIATLGLAHHGADEIAATAMQFMEAGSLQNADTLVWNMEALTVELAQEIEPHTHRTLSVKGSETLLAMSRHWRQELKDFLTKGGTVIAFLPSQLEIGIHTLEEIMPYNLLEPLCIASTTTISSDTPSMICHAGEPFQSLFAEISTLLRPTCTLQHYPGIPVLHDQHEAVLACFYAQVPGRILLLPTLNDQAWSDSQQRHQFYESLQTCITRFGQTTGIHNANWIAHYALQQEGTLLAEHSKAVLELGHLQKKIREIEESIHYHNFFKQIIAGTTDTAYIAIGQAFRGKGEFVQPDWVHSNVLLIEQPDHFLVVQIRLPNEIIDASFIAEIAHSKERVEAYFTKPTEVLFVDAAQNALALPARHISTTDMQQLHAQGFLYLSSHHLYGWYLDTPQNTLALLVQKLRQQDTTYLQNLQKIVDHALQPSNLDRLPISTEHTPLEQVE